MVWVPEGYVNTGELLVLEQVPDQLLQRSVGSDGELSQSVTVRIRLQVLNDFLERT